MTVDLEDGRRIFGVDIHEYRNAKDYYKGTNDISEDHDVTAGMSVAWADLSRKIRKHGTKIRKGTYSIWLPIPKPGADPEIQIEEVAVMAQFVGVFSGKGSPTAIRQTLKLTAAFGLCDATAASMNSYCQAFIGLDCSGFVGNYLKHMGHGSIGPSTPAKSFAPEVNRLSKLSDIQAGCVICWKNVGHVAVIDRVLSSTGSDVECKVVESTGSSLIPGDVHTDGMNHTTYHVKSVDSAKVFKVKRGIGGSGLNSVYIAKVL